MIKDRIPKIWEGSELLENDKKANSVHIWRRSQSLRFWQFIRFGIDHNDESFGIELGWNIERKVAIPNFLDPRTLEFHTEAYNLTDHCFSLKLLSSGNAGEWRFFELEEMCTIEYFEKLNEPISCEDAEKKVVRVFEDAFKLLKETGIPYLHQIEKLKSAK
ncbi:MAG: hypothetical protein ACSHX0_12370 [Akkermansiaceae bacterium]